MSDEVRVLVGTIAFGLGIVANIIIGLLAVLNGVLQGMHQ